jgi:hypothetical protein
MLMNEAIMATRMEGTVSNMGAKKIEHLMALEVIRRRLLIAMWADERRGLSIWIAKKGERWLNPSQGGWHVGPRWAACWATEMVATHCAIGTIWH